jgi:hypothetical protein
MRSPWPLLALALAFAACQPVRPSLIGAGTGAPTYVPPPSGAPRPLSAGGRLVGKSKIPEGLVAASSGLLQAQGAAIVSNGGAALTNNGGAALSPTAGMPAAGASAAPYGLLAEGQKPLAGFAVRLLDAAGQPLLDPAGKPYTATTDANGDYAFAETPAGKNAIVALDLPNGLGRVMGFLPAPAGLATRNVDLEGVGTHVLGYLLDQHVKGDAARFERLDPKEEQAARADAEAALTAAAGGRLVADSLATARLLAKVEVWRELSQPFDQRLKAIARALDGLPPAIPSPSPTRSPSVRPSASLVPSAGPSGAAS